MQKDQIIVGIIGAGQMGQGIAELFWLNGNTVLLYDSNVLTLQKAQEQLLRRLQKAIEKGKIREESRELLESKLQICCNFTPYTNCSLIIEAVSENETIKSQIFSSLETVMSSTCILATNTSSLSITQLAKHVAQPENFLGIHFFNPAHVMPLVEVIPHAKTASSFTEQAINILKSVGKSPVQCTDSPGFIVNRLLLPLINQAASLVDAGIASPKDVDQAMTLGANFPMGPLALADFIGLDTVVAILEVLQKDLKDDAMAPAHSLRAAVSKGHLGTKTGQGFFIYNK